MGAFQNRIIFAVVLGKRVYSFLGKKKKIHPLHSKTGSFFIYEKWGKHQPYTLSTCLLLASRAWFKHARGRRRAPRKIRRWQETADLLPLDQISGLRNLQSVEESKLHACNLRKSEGRRSLSILEYSIWKKNRWKKIRCKFNSRR